MPLNEYEKLLFSSAKEVKLSRLETLRTLDNNEFWNPKSMETLIFNSYVGGACIFEYHNGEMELLRVNEQYSKELGIFKEDCAELSDAQTPLKRLDIENEIKLFENIEKAIATGRESNCVLVLTDKNDSSNVEYIRSTVRVIAKTGERFLFYCVIVNMTEQRVAEQKRIDAERKENENAQLLQIIMSNINGGVSAIQIFDNGTSQFVFNNDRYFDLYGYTKEEAMATRLDVLSLIVPEDFGMVMAKVKKLKADRKPTIIDYRIRKRDGRLAYLRVNASMMQMAGYGDDVITSVVTDITEQKELTDQLQAIIDNINGGVTATILKENSQEFIIVNDKFFDLLGYTREQYYEECEDKYSIIHPDDKERVIRQLEASTEVGREYTMEYRVVCRDKTVKYIQNNLSVINIFGIEEPVQLSVANDVTEIKESKQKVAEAADKLRTVMNHAGNGITAMVLRNERTEFLFANDKYYEIHGCTRNEYRQRILGDSLKMVYEPDREYVRSQVIAAKTKKSLNFEYRIKQPDGNIRWIKAVEATTELVGIDAPVQITVFTDVTEEKRLNEKLTMLNVAAHDILAQTDSEIAIRSTLYRLMDFFKGARAYIFEADYATQTVDNTYEVCAEGVESEINRLKGVSFDVCRYWFNAFNNNRYVVIKDVSAMGDEEADMREILAMQNIRSLIVAPLWRDGVLIGYSGIDNPTDELNSLDNLMAFGDYLAVLLTRRDLNRKIKHDSEAMKQLIDDTPGGFCRMRIKNGEAPCIVTVNEGFCNMLDLSVDEVMANYGKDITSCITAIDSDGGADFGTEKESGTQFTVKCRLLRKDGSGPNVMIFGRYVMDEDGGLYLNTYFTDITDQSHAEEQQKRLLDNLPCGAALYETDGITVNSVHINKKYWELVGREPTDYSSNSGKTIFDVIHKDEIPLLFNEINDAIKQKRNVRIEVRILCGDGNYKTFRIIANVIKQASGKYAFYTTYEALTDNMLTVQEMLPVALSTMLSMSGDLSYVKDRELHYICCSQSLARFLSVKDARELVGKTDKELFGEKIAAEFEEDDLTILRTKGAITDRIEKVPAADGSVRLIDTCKYPIMDSSGDVVGIYGVSRDVTMQREKESQLELLTASIPGGLAAYSVIGNDIKMLYFNDGYYTYSGYTREEYLQMIAKDSLALIHPDDRQLVRDVIKNMIGSGEKNNTQSCVYRCVTKSGAERWMSIKGALTKLDGDDYVLNVVQFDITEQKEVENNLRRSEEEYRIATLHIGSMIGRYDVATRTLHWAPDIAKRMNQPECMKDVPNSSLRLGLISADTQAAYEGFYEDIINGVKDGTVVFQKQLPSGWRWVSAHYTTIFGENGKPSTAIISVVDVTEEQQKEAIYKKWRQTLQEKDKRLYTLYRCNLNKNIVSSEVEGELFDNDTSKFRGLDSGSKLFAQLCVTEEDKEKYLSFMSADGLLANYYRGTRSSSIDFRCKLNDDVRWVRLSAELVAYPNSTEIEAYLMFEDVNDAKLRELMVKEQSETYSLTGVYNRKTFVENLENIVKTSASGSQHAFMMLDVDAFKHINDSLGHQAGDAVLMDISKSVQSVLRHSDLVGRMGGDEFFIFIQNVGNRTFIAQKAEQICGIVRKKLKDNITVSASIGIACFPNDGAEFQTLYEKADKALYYVKKHNKDGYAFFDELE